MSDFQTLEEGLGKDATREALHLRAALAAPTTATLLLDGENNMAELQDLLGHRHIKTTAGYARVAVDLIRQVQSPLEHLNLAATAPD